MNKSKPILEELDSISPQLAMLHGQVPYNVPEGYFESFPVSMLYIINNKLSQDENVSDQRVPGLLEMPKAMPFSVPDQYFDKLAGNLIDKIREKGENPSEELNSISPFLAGLVKTNPFTLPENYFENLQPNPEVKPKSEPAKVFVLGTWKRFAAAAIFAGIIFTTVVFYLNNTSAGANNNTVVSVSDKALEDFLTIGDPEMLTEPLAEDENITMALLDINENTIREVLLTVDDNAIREYMNENPDADFSNKMN